MGAHRFAPPLFNSLRVGWVSLLFQFSCLRVTQTACARQEGLSRTEVEIHVQTNGQVVLIVRDVERHHFLFLAVFLFYKGEDQATVRCGGVSPS